MIPDRGRLNVELLCVESNAEGGFGYADSSRQTVIVSYSAAMRDAGADSLSA